LLPDPDLLLPLGQDSSPGQQLTDHTASPLLVPTRVASIGL
jgi:hypothetical protein